MKKAIVTAVIGDPYRQLWHNICRPSWERYANRYGYELLLIEKLADTSELAAQRSPAWQKLLALSVPETQPYDRIVWLDSDILINPLAPSIIEGVPREKIGAVRDQAIGASPALRTAFERTNEMRGDPKMRAQRFYQGNNLPTDFDYFLNTGVLVLDRDKHRELLEMVYEHYPQTPQSYFEQVPLSYEIIKNGLHHELDPRFNAMWLEYKQAFYPFTYAIGAFTPLCLAVAYTNSYFLHFAASLSDLPAFDPKIRVDGKQITFSTEFVGNLVQSLSQGMQRAGVGAGAPGGTPGPETGQAMDASGANAPGGGLGGGSVPGAMPALTPSLATPKQIGSTPVPESSPSPGSASAPKQD